MNSAHLFDLSDDVAVVTGAGRGIGEGIARVMAGAGAAVVVAARRSEEIERVADQIRKDGGRAIAVTTDVTDDSAVEALAQAARNEFGKLDIWVNNAGGSPIQSKLTRLPRDEWDATLRLNLTAVWTCSVIADKYLEDGGRILNISSKAAVGPIPGSGHYAAAKAGVNSLTATFAAELGPRVRVNCIMPGAFMTDISKAWTPEMLAALERMTPLGRAGQPDEIVGTALYLASDASSYTTGSILKVDGGAA